jgi:hypothetical protein
MNMQNSLKAERDNERYNFRGSSESLSSSGVKKGTTKAADDSLGSYEGIELANRSTNLPEGATAYSSNVPTPIYEEIFSGYTFSCLKKDAQDEVLAAVDSFLATGVVPDFNSEAVNVMFENQFTARNEVLSFASDILTDTIPDDILLEENKAKLKAYKNEQYFMLYHYLARYQAVTGDIEEIKERTGFAKYVAKSNETDTVKSQYTEQVNCFRHLRLCAKLLKLNKFKVEHDNSTTQEELAAQLEDFNETLDNLRPPKPPSFVPSYVNKYGEDEYYLDKDQDEQDSDYFIRQLRRGNQRRLCWLWDRIVMELFVTVAQATLLLTTLIAEQVSWSLYLFLAAVHLVGVFGHSFDALVGEKERQIDAKKRALAHLMLRLDWILNDLVWGFANLACCFWLYGLGTYGYIGDVVTVLLLGMDLTLSALRYTDGEKNNSTNITTYNKQLKTLFARMLETADEDLSQKVREISDLIESNTYELDEKFAAIDALILEKRAEDGADKNVFDNLSVILWQTKLLHQAKEGCKSKWEEEKTFLAIDVIYSVSLVLGFAVLCGFYLSVIPVAMPSMMVVIGAIALGASTLFYRTANSVVTCNNTSQSQIESNNNYDTLLDKFIDNNGINSHLSENEMKQLYLHILQKGAQAGNQQDLLVFQKMEFGRETINRIFVPASIALTLLFAPALTLGVPTYIFLLVGVLILAAAASTMIKKVYKPRDTAWQVEKGSKSTKSQPVLVESEYNHFKSFVKKDGRETVKQKVLDGIKKARCGDNADMFEKLTLESSSSSF